VSGFVSSMKLWKSSVFYPCIALIIVVCFLASFIAYFKVYRIVRRHQAQIDAQIQVVSANAENHLNFKRLRRSSVVQLTSGQQKVTQTFTESCLLSLFTQRVNFGYSFYITLLVLSFLFLQNQTFLQISGIYPRESVSVKVNCMS
jgi:hypothetical protein